MQDAGGYFGPEECDPAALEALIDRVTTPADAPGAAQIVRNVPIYVLAAPDRAPGRALLAEWAQVLRYGPGVLVLRGSFADHAVLDAATAVYTDIIAGEKAAAGAGADHFGAAGANDRVWNALQKLCMADPALFLRYFGNPAIAAVCEAWLGPQYQMTAQVNLVHPGGAAQQAHRDYHLGFQTAESAALFPAHVHELSPLLTLQGAVAHCDMPVESGPTKLLPFSQGFRPGYVAFRLPAFRALFEARCVQVPLEKGDVLFFNPALLHAAGANVSPQIERMANLLQVSSAFGRAMESVDRAAMCLKLYPAAQAGVVRGAALDAAIAAAAEGYSFPTNLDRDPPVGGLAPLSQAALFRRALAEGMPVADFAAALADLTARQGAG